VLPILTRMLDRPHALRALVLAPTRELAAQIETAARDLARFTRLRVGVVYGGVNIGPQERMLRGEGVDLLVATPGRLLDLQGRQSVALDDIEFLVLDEADRMVDMGFAPDLKRILRLLPRDRQTMMFSATMPPALNDVAREALVDPVRLDLAPRPAPWPASPRPSTRCRAGSRPTCSTNCCVARTRAG
jgi:ATP-dependent RNA helicase RhlE